jgi:hypothetical protein
VPIWAREPLLLHSERDNVSTHNPHRRQNTAVKPQVARAFDGDEYQSDLNPDAMAGQNIGAVGAHPEKGTRTVHDFKELHAGFSEWSDGALKQIPVVPEGSRLEQNATYIDLMAATPPSLRPLGARRPEAATAMCRRARCHISFGTTSRCKECDAHGRCGERLGGERRSIRSSNGQRCGFGSLPHIADLVMAGFRIGHSASGVRRGRE